jgi:hypothetical protein
LLRRVSLYRKFVRRNCLRSTQRLHLGHLIEHPRSALECNSTLCVTFAVREAYLFGIMRNVQCGSIPNDCFPATCYLRLADRCSDGVLAHVKLSNLIR